MPDRSLTRVINDVHMLTRVVKSLQFNVETGKSWKIISRLQKQTYGTDVWVKDMRQVDGGLGPNEGSRVGGEERNNRSCAGQRQSERQQDDS